MNPIAIVVSIMLQASAIIDISVRSPDGPVAGADVVVAGQTTRTQPNGHAQIPVVPGMVIVTVAKDGFVAITTRISVAPGQQQTLDVDLTPNPTLEEVVTVSATRSNRRVEDQATRVETIDAEEIEEKQLMTPGDIVMMLNEMGGMRVQATSPSLGATSVRVQGMRGRYTRFLSDGLPLYGDVGGLGLLQIPPSDLGRVEVIKGVASALYGAGALGGVVDLLSRRPGKTPVRDALVNRTTLGGTDVVLFAGQPMTNRWSGTMLVGGHWQTRSDRDEDGWVDVPGYSRAVVRPRLFWSDDTGRSMFFTTGVMWETRNGGTTEDRIPPAVGSAFLESLDTLRIDGGLVLQAPVAGRYVATLRFSSNRHRGDHVTGDIQEHDVRGTLFAEAAVRGSAPRQTWVAGAAFERATLESAIRRDLGYSYNVPGGFVQDDVEIARWLIASASARVDTHNQFGTFASPRLSALLRGGDWNARWSLGSGFFAPSGLTDETEAAGLTRLTVPKPLVAERGRSLSLDVSRTRGALAMTATLFRYLVRDPVVVNRATYTLTNLSDATVTAGLETVITYRREPISVTATYSYVHAREGLSADRDDVPLTPRQSAGFVTMWERQGVGRAGFEAYFTGRQRLEDNPYRSRSAAYVLFGGLVERALGRFRLFANAENLANVRQTDWNPLIRPARAADGRWTVDAWAPLDGRVVNGGIRIAF